MSYEKTQKGNPYSLTICQHAFPAASIARFAGNDGRVDVYLIHQKKQIRLKPEDQLFCAKRVWDQRAESGYMKEIEDKYQLLAGSIISGSKQTISNDEQLTITDMFAIWNIREHGKTHPNRQVAGLTLQLTLFQFRKQMRDAHWGIVRASKGQFIVPDNFSNARILPLAPNICFFSEHDDALLGEDEVRKINQIALDSSQNYYFGHEIENCPT